MRNATDKIFDAVHEIFNSTLPNGTTVLDAGELCKRAHSIDRATRKFRQFLSIVETNTCFVTNAK